MPKYLSWCSFFSFWLESRQSDENRHWEKYNCIAIFYNFLFWNFCTKPKIRKQMKPQKIGKPQRQRWQKDNTICNATKAINTAAIPTRGQRTDMANINHNKTFGRNYGQQGDGPRSTHANPSFSCSITSAAAVAAMTTCIHTKRLAGYTFIFYGQRMKEI